MPWPSDHWIALLSCSESSLQSRSSIAKATTLGNYVSGPLEISFRSGRAEFSNKATMK